MFIRQVHCDGRRTNASVRRSARRYMWQDWLTTGRLPSLPLELPLDFLPLHRRSLGLWPPGWVLFHPCLVNPLDSGRLARVLLCGGSAKLKGAKARHIYGFMVCVGDGKRGMLGQSHGGGLAICGPISIMPRITAATTMAIINAHSSQLIPLSMAVLPPSTTKRPKYITGFMV